MIAVNMIKVNESMQILSLVAKDLKNPRRDVLLSMTIGLVLLFFVQSILGIGMTNYVSLDILANDPAGTPHMTYATNLLAMQDVYGWEL